VAVPFRVGVMQLTMEPLDEMLASARAMDDAGMDTIWLAEAYPWWRKHQMEARSSTVVSALMARETTRLTIGWGIISPWTRHPVQVAMDARVVQEAAGHGRFLLGFGTSKIFLNNIKGQTKKIEGVLAQLEAEAKSLKGKPTIGTISVACALGYLDYRFAAMDWRAKHPKLAKWFNSTAKTPAMKATPPPAA